MKDYSHRFKTREKQATRRFFIAILLIFSLIFGSIFFGLPIMAKIIIFFSSFNNEKIENIVKKQDMLIFPPIIDTLPQATNSARISIKGNAAKGNKVQIFQNEKMLEEIDLDDDGKFSYSKINLEEGLNSIKTRQINQDKISDFSEKQEIRYIKDKPQFEITTPENGKKYYSDENNIEIKGTTDSENKIYFNNKMVVVENDGEFIYRAKLNDGENVFKIKAVDIAGNLTEEEFKLLYQP